MRLKPILCLCAFAVLALSGCGGTQEQPIAVPTQPPTPTVEVGKPTTAAVDTPTPSDAQTPGGDQGGLMVTQAGYEAALAKWQGQRIASYKMSVTVEVIEVPQPVLNGDWTVMVSEGGRKVDAISRPLGAPGPDPANTEDLSYLTVEQQFDTIRTWFGESVPKGVTRRATFDPTLGYPTLVEDKFQSTGGTIYPGGSGGISVVIHSLEVVEQGAPKTPAPETPIPSSNDE